MLSARCTGPCQLSTGSSPSKLCWKKRKEKARKNLEKHGKQAVRGVGAPLAWSACACYRGEFEGRRERERNCPLLSVVPRYPGISCACILTLGVVEKGADGSRGLS